MVAKVSRAESNPVDAEAAMREKAEASVRMMAIKPALDRAITRSKEAMARRADVIRGEDKNA